MFAFAWTPLLLAGSGSVLSLDAAITDWASQQAAAARRQARRSRPAAPEIHRREVLLRLGSPRPRSCCREPGHRRTGRGPGQAGRRDRRPRPARQACPRPPVPVPAAQSRPSQAAHRARSRARFLPARPSAQRPTCPSARPPRSRIRPLVIRRSGSSRAPASSWPSTPHADRWLAVGYDPTSKMIICPCHGSQFNASTGAVEVWSSATGLKRLAIAEGS